MIEYEVIWHDCQDDRTGNPFKVKASNPVDAYSMAEEKIKGYSTYLRDHFSPIDIECLVDGEGNYHRPDIFLEKDN